MIENLNKSHESVHFRENAHIRMYNNIQDEAYPPHWHNETEIILVRSGKLHVRCGGVDSGIKNRFFCDDTCSSDFQSDSSHRLPSLSGIIPSHL